MRAVVFLYAAALWPGAVPADEQVLSELVLRNPEIAILGEAHDNPEHHVNQTRAVELLAPKALVFEMLSPRQAARGATAPRADVAALEAALGWDDSGWPDFAMYHPIFAAAPDARLYGAEVPATDLRRAVETGAAAVFGGQAARFGLDRALAPEDKAEREAEQVKAHCDALPTDRLAGMVEAQRLRDAALAGAALTAHAETGGPVVVITGNGHARRDRGIPAMLALAAPGLTIVSLGQMEGTAPPDAPFDLVIVTDAPERGDPCLAFR